ncbi:MAG: nucleoside monophosphate kinase [Holosporaceae bacterium]|jgi:adenylate kinase|nr:nucleoside monophosphate kinase [Holosporaceae bacterium]
MTGTMTEMITILIFMGAPGSGKGTVAQHLKEKYVVSCFSTGNLLRNEVKEKTAIGRRVEGIIGVGGLVGDDVVNGIVEKNIEKVAAGGKGVVVILDGYPRTEGQARVLDGMKDGKFRNSIHVIELDVDADEVVARISQRRVCAKCGNTYGAMDKIEICSCGGELIKRKDDEEATVRNRLKEYEKATLPLSEYYFDRIVKINGKGTVEEVVKRVDDYFDGLGIERRR